MVITEIQDLKKIILEKIERYDSIGILTHKQPDGDGLGASLSLQEILTEHHLKAEIILENEISDTYDFLDGKARTRVFSDDLKYDLVFLLDCHETERVGKCAPLVSTAKEIITIDHHINGKPIVEAFNFTDPAFTSVGTIMFILFEEEIRKLEKQKQKFIAEAVYTTILNDTDNFLNANTDTRTFQICAELTRLGLNPGETSEKFLMRKSVANIKFIGETLSTIETHSNGKFLFIHSTEEMFKKNNLPPDAANKMTRWVKGTEKVEVVVYFHEIRKKEYRISLRSSMIDVNKIAKKFDGGGHKAASGCRINGSLEEVKGKILTAVVFAGSEISA